MNEEYRKLMMHQSPSTEMDTAFYENLERAQPTKTYRITWKAAVAVVCVLLLIPVTVWAAETIFGVTKVTKIERPTLDNKPGIGLDIQYENLENYDLKDFSKSLQALEETQVISHTSWEEAEKYMGIELLQNPVLTEDHTKNMTPFDGSKLGEREHCLGIYRVADGQFISGSIGAGYQRNGVDFILSATATAQHPTANLDNITNDHHGTSITFLDKNGIDITTEQYMTRADIPVLIVTVSRNQLNMYDSGAEIIECNAYFAVNNVSYSVINYGFSFSSMDRETYSGAKEKVMEVMLEILDGFVIE